MAAHNHVSMTTENDVVTTPAEEVVQPEGTATPTPEPEATVGQVLHEKPEPETIPKARLDKEIARRKEAEARAENALAELSKRAASEGMSKAEITTDLQALANKHNIDPGFLNELAGSIKAQAEAGIEERLRPLAEREKQQKIDSAFNQGFTRALENMPDYKDIVNPAVIKTLSLDPSNANKTFSQLIEDTYGNALGGRKSIERTTPRGGNASGQLDYERANKDGDYFKEVMADPTLKKQYNDRMISES
jgi:hypothetical protein